MTAAVAPPVAVTVGSCMRPDCGHRQISWTWWWRAVRFPTRGAPAGQYREGKAEHW